MPFETCKHKVANHVLRITEIYHTIQGESSYMGLPCVMVRLTGCNLRCTYCDTDYAFEGGEKVSLEDVLLKIASFNCSLVEITGGEPLLQDEAYTLINRLCESGYTVLVETGGSRPIQKLHPATVIIMDIKCPSSQESGSLHMDNLDHLKFTDQVKFVISDRFDYDWAVHAIKNYNINCPILFSPSHNVLRPQELAEWILKDNLNVRLQLQMHKYIWGPNAQGV